jgi:hypothetical protein
MSEQIRVELEQDTISPGNILYGTVHLQGDISKATAVNCRLGYSASRHSEFVEVVCGEISRNISPGMTEAALPFEVKLPETAPVSYKGKEVSIDWLCEVSLDVPWAIDPMKRVPFTVRPRPEDEQPAPDQPLPEKPKGAVGGCLSTFGPYLLIPFILMFIPHMIIFAVILAPPFLFWRLLQWMKVSEFSFTAEPLKEVKLGSPIRYLLTFTSRTSFDVSEITIALEGEEVWTTGSGKSRTTHRHTFLNDVQRPCKAARLPVGRFRHEGSFVLPPHFPTSISSTIEYKITANIDIPWWPDVSEGHPIEVIGVVAGGAEESFAASSGVTAAKTTFLQDPESGVASPLDDFESKKREDRGFAGDDSKAESDATSPCPSCRQPVRDDVFCPHCGLRLRL